MLGDEPSLDALMGCLERRGAREGALHGALLRNRDAIIAGMPAGPLQCARLLLCSTVAHTSAVVPRHTGLSVAGRWAGKCKTASSC